MVLGASYIRVWCPGFFIFRLGWYMYNSRQVTSRFFPSSFWIFSKCVLWQASPVRALWNYLCTEVKSHSVISFCVCTWQLVRSSIEGSSWRIRFQTDSTQGDPRQDRFLEWGSALVHPLVIFKKIFSPFGHWLRGFLSYPCSTSTYTTSIALLWLFDCQCLFGRASYFTS